MQMYPAAQFESLTQAEPLVPAPSVTQARTMLGPLETSEHFCPVGQPQLGTRPQGVSVQVEQLPVESQTAGRVHVPQEIPHTGSGPQVRPVQLGVQAGMH
jgi:hypothetical protein